MSDQQNSDKSIHPLVYEIAKNENRFIQLAEKTGNPLYLWADMFFGGALGRNEINEIIVAYLEDCAYRMITLLNENITPAEMNKKLNEVFQIGTTEIRNFIEDDKAFQTVSEEPKLIDSGSDAVVYAAKDKTGLSHGTVHERRKRAKDLLTTQLPDSSE